LKILEQRLEKARSMHHPTLGPNLVERKEDMALSPFDILKRHEDGSFIWLEAAPDLQTAQARLRELCARVPGDYFVFDQKSQQIVARLSTRTVANE
jgi:hypothetical protein